MCPVVFIYITSLLPLDPSGHHTVGGSHESLQNVARSRAFFVVESLVTFGRCFELDYLSSFTRSFPTLKI